MNEENSLLTGAVRPALLRYALPIILSMVGNTVLRRGRYHDHRPAAGCRCAGGSVQRFHGADDLTCSSPAVMELGGGLLVAAGKPTATKHEMTELLYNLAVRG